MNKEHTNEQFLPRSVKNREPPLPRKSNKKKKKKEKEMKYPGGSRERDCPDERPMAWKVLIDEDLDNRAIMITMVI